MGFNFTSKAGNPSFIIEILIVKLVTLLLAVGLVVAFKRNLKAAAGLDVKQ